MPEVPPEAPRLTIPCPTCGCFEHPEDPGLPPEVLAVLQDPDQRWDLDFEANQISTLVTHLREQPQGVWQMGRRGLLSLILAAKAVGAAQGREACAKLAEEKADRWAPPGILVSHMGATAAVGAREIAKAIRKSSPVAETRVENGE